MRDINTIKTELRAARIALDKKWDDLPAGLDFKEYENALNPEQSIVSRLAHELHLIDVPTMHEPPEYGDKMTLDLFVECVKDGGFIDYDGAGNYGTDTEMSSITILPSYVARGLRSDFTHVYWFNR